MSEVDMNTLEVSANEVTAPVSAERNDYNEKRLDDRRAKTKKVIKTIVVVTILFVIGLFFLFPFAYMVFKSLMGDLESVGVYGTTFLPTFEGWHFENYIKVFQDSAQGEGILKYTLNTLIIVVLNMIGVPLAACMCAYGFGRGKFRGKGFWFAFVLATIMLPGVVTQVPVYVMFKILGLRGTIWTMIIPPWLGGGALNIFLARQFIKTLPRSLDEAAVIDGAGKMRIFLTIILPLLKPMVIFMMVNTFMTFWREFDSALIYIGNTKGSQAHWTLSLFVYYKYVSSNEITSNIKMTTGVIMAVPIAILFVVFQRQLIDGVVMSGMKD